MNQNKVYLYKFENGESYQMTPIDAHKYAHKKKIKIIEGVNYSGGRQKKSFDGWGYHESLKKVFRGPKDYKAYLKKNGIEEWGNENPPKYTEESPPVWDDAMLKRCWELGIEVSSREADALKKGLVKFPGDPA